MLVHILEGFDMSKVIKHREVREDGFPVVRTTYNFDAAAWSDANGLRCEDPSLTVQSQAEEADINTIVRNFGVTGQLPVGARVPTYGDFEGISDYKEAIAAVRAAEDSFLMLPAELRARLDNDPQRFLEFAADPSNLEEMRRLGLAPALASEASS